MSWEKAKGIFMNWWELLVSKVLDWENIFFLGLSVCLLFGLRNFYFYFLRGSILWCSSQSSDYLEEDLTKISLKKILHEIKNI
jgi:hypothetical protein